PGHERTAPNYLHRPLLPSGAHRVALAGRQPATLRVQRCAQGERLLDAMQLHQTPLIVVALAGCLASASAQRPRGTTAAQQPRFLITPRQPSGGTLCRLTIDRLARHGDSVINIT